MLLGLLLFIFKGRAAWAAGWLYLALYSAWSVGNTVLLLRRHPGLLLKRLMFAPEPAAGPDRFFAKAAPLLAAVTLTVCAVYGDWPRGGWWLLPRLLAFAGIAAAYGLASWAMACNAFAMKAVLIQAEQVVVRAGPYAAVRHPVYAASLLLCVCTPAALGSLRGFAPAALVAALLAAHAGFEDRFLAAKLAGYGEYSAQVRWKLIPGVW